jgi:bromodomain-containing factor 1
MNSTLSNASAIPTEVSPHNGLVPGQSSGDQNGNSEGKIPTTTINSEIPAATALLSTNPTTSETSESEINKSSEILSTSTIPPVITAPESDLRDAPVAVQAPDSLAIEDHVTTVKMDGDPSTKTIATEITTETDHTNIKQDTVDSVESTSDAIDQIPTSPNEQPLHPASISNIDLNTDGSSQPSTSLEPTQVDTLMTDAPSSTKMAREREEDTEDGPSPKRTKMGAGDSFSDFAVPDTPKQNGHGDVGDSGINKNLPPTPYQVSQLQKALRSAKGTTNGKNFKGPVAELWPTIAEGYLAKVPNPIDLSLIERKLKAGYAKLADFKADVNRIYDNSVLFNGEAHTVTLSAKAVRDNLFSKIPPAEPPKVERKQKKSTPVAEAAPRRPAPRRPSGGSHTSHAGAATTSGAAQTFALDPSGTPLIRRDSTKGDLGRPKREIHPPKSKDLIYSARPKKKKFIAELRFCEEVLAELKRPRHVAFAAAFMHPVDPVALNIPTYFKVIKNPIDLSTITSKLDSGQYESSKDFEADIRLMFRNCYKFNPEGSPVNHMGHQLENVFDHEWAKKDRWVSDHTVSTAASPDSSAESEQEESDEEDADEVPSTTASTAIQARLIEEQTKLINIMNTKKPEPALIKMQQEMIAIVQKQLEEANKQAAAAKKPKTKAKRAAPTKKDTKKKSSAYKSKHIGFAEKEQISAGIGQLEGKQMDAAIALLKVDLPGLDVGFPLFFSRCVVLGVTLTSLQLENEPELDIDSFSQVTLSKIHDLIVKYCPHVVPPPEPRSRAPPKPSKPKKNKPMGKHEQENNIKRLKALSQQFASRQGSYSDDAMPGGAIPCTSQSYVNPPPPHRTDSQAAVEQAESSGDESPSDSEED